MIKKLRCFLGESSFQPWETSMVDASNSKGTAGGYLNSGITMIVIFLSWAIWLNNKTIRVYYGSNYLYYYPSSSQNHDTSYCMKIESKLVVIVHLPFVYNASWISCVDCDNKYNEGIKIETIIDVGNKAHIISKDNYA